MPIIVKAPEGLIESGAEERLFADVMGAFLAINGSSLRNGFIGPNLIGNLEIMPKGSTFAAGRHDDWVAVQLRVPSFALTEADQKAAFVEQATDAVMRATGGRLPRARVFVNMVYGDGFWGHRRHRIHRREPRRRHRARGLGPTLLTTERTFPWTRAPANRISRPCTG